MVSEGGTGCDSCTHSEVFFDIALVNFDRNIFGSQFLQELSAHSWYQRGRFEPERKNHLRLRLLEAIDLGLLQC